MLDKRLIYYEEKRIKKRKFDKIHSVFKARDELVFVVKMIKSSSNKRKRENQFFIKFTKMRRKFTLLRNNPHVDYATTLFAMFVVTSNYE